MKGSFGSFKFKLVAYFVLLSLVPLAAAFWGFSTVAKRAETRTVDARLQAGLRAAVAGYQDELRNADRSAASLARDPAFERALLAHNRRALARLLRGRRNLTIVIDGLRIGRPVARAATRQVAVVGPGDSHAAVIASVPLDGALVRRLEARSGLEAHDHLVLIEGGRVVGGVADLHGTAHVQAGRPETVRVAGTRYRGLFVGTKEQPGATLGVLSPQSAIDAANWTATRRLLLGLLASLLLVASVAYVEGRAIVRTVRRLVEAARAIARGDLRQRVPVQGRDELALLGRTFNQMASQLDTRLNELAAERARLRNAISRFGDVLAATHDLDQLRQVIVETAMEATGASGGVLVGETGELVQAGVPDKGAERIEVPLLAGQVSFGSLLVFGDGFDDDDRMAAASLGAQAVVALENARLHRIVERQARIDGLTGLANRRSGEDHLEVELSRVARFGGPLGVVLADLDDFKVVNDRFGHAAGDVVLREFARALEEGIRDVDLACRWGGEEFVLLLPGTDLQGAANLADRIRTALEARLVLSPEGEPIHVTASFGVAEATAEADSPRLLAAADSALYQAKRTGKNRVTTSPEVVSQP